MQRVSKRGARNRGHFLLAVGAYASDNSVGMTLFGYFGSSRKLKHEFARIIKAAHSKGLKWPVGFVFQFPTYDAAKYWLDLNAYPPKPQFILRGNGLGVRMVSWSAHDEKDAPDADTPEGS